MQQFFDSYDELVKVFGSEPVVRTMVADGRIIIRNDLASMPYQLRLTPQEICTEIERLCRTNGYVICGTCDMEGIYGEITVQRVGAKDGVGSNAFNWEIGSEAV